MIDIVALGEILIDFTPSGENDQGIALFARNPGGAPANVLAMNTKLGGSSAFIGKVGADAFGAYLRSTLVRSGIDDSGLVTDPAIPTTLAFVQLDEKGDRSFSFYRKPGADMMLTSTEIRRELIDQCRIFHFGSVSLTDEPCRGAMPVFIKRCSICGINGTARGAISASSCLTIWSICWPTEHATPAVCWANARRRSSWRRTAACIPAIFMCWTTSGQEACWKTPSGRSMSLPSCRHSHDGPRRPSRSAQTAPTGGSAAEAARGCAGRCSTPRRIRNVDTGSF